MSDRRDRLRRCALALGLGLGACVLGGPLQADIKGGVTGLGGLSGVGGLGNAGAPAAAGVAPIGPAPSKPKATVVPKAAGAPPAAVPNGLPPLMAAPAVTTGVVSAPPAAHTAGHGPQGLAPPPGNAHHAPVRTLPPRPLSGPHTLPGAYPGPTGPPHLARHPGNGARFRLVHDKHASAHKPPRPSSPLARLAAAFGLRHGLMAVVAAVLLALYVRQRRERNASHDFERAAHYAKTPAHQPRAVVLQHGGNDPTVSFHEDPVADRAASAAALDILTSGSRLRAATADAAPEPAIATTAATGQAPRPAAPSATAAPSPPAAATVTAPAAPLSGHGFVPSVKPLIPGDAAPSLAPAAFGGEPLIRLADGAEDSVQLRREAAAPLPAALAMHFDALPGEVVKWSAPFRVPLLSRGLVAVTTQRLLAVYEAREGQVFPPRLAMRLRRHQCLLATITKHDADSVHRPSLLVGSALLLLWYPVGTLLALIGVAAYFLWMRPVLSVWTGSVRRRYPLAPLDQRDAQAMLALLIAKKLKENQTIDHRGQQAS